MLTIQEELWFGEDTDDEAEKRAASSMAARAGRVLGAKPFPVAARQLESLTRTPNAPLEKVIKVLEGDPGLSARLLRLVNSAGYALRVRCTSVGHAAALVGTERLNQVATTAAILDMFDAESSLAVHVLEHTTVVGSLCRYLAVHFGLPRDDLFTCGFLHDIGKLMLLDTDPDEYALLLEAYKNEPDRIHLEERKLFGFDHAVLAAHVLSAWNIPEPVPQVVAWHHQVARAYRASSVQLSMVHALRLADALSYALLVEDPKPELEQIAKSEAAGYLDISEAQLGAMWNDLVALSERGRTHGAVEEVSIVPRRLDVPESLRPRTGWEPRPGDAMVLEPAPQSEAPHTPAPSVLPREPVSVPPPRSLHAPASVSKVPRHFPCVACEQPSYGNRCACCGGYVCPEHLAVQSEWCLPCVEEFSELRDDNALPQWTHFVAGAVLVVPFAIALVLELGVGGAIGPLTLVILFEVLVVVGHRWWLRARFVRARRQERLWAELAEASEDDATGDAPVPAEVAAEAPADGIESTPPAFVASGAPEPLRASSWPVVAKNGSGKPDEMPSVLSVLAPPTGLVPVRDMPRAEPPPTEFVLIRPEALAAQDVTADDDTPLGLAGESPPSAAVRAVVDGQSQRPLCTPAPEQATVAPLSG